jgi:signal transduction histidine kinase
MKPPVAMPLRVLILEDRSADADLMIHELQQAGFAPDCRRVASERDYVDALNVAASGAAFDIVLADYSLPGFNALAALAELKRRDLKPPFIVVTGSLEDEAAVECIKQGATDYLLKDRLKRLGAAVTRALDQRRERVERERAEEQLRQSREIASEALRQANATLERRIAERTQALTEANRKLMAEMAERQRVEGALRQAQKLEAIGRLGGGIAHNFNNLLTIVLGNLDMAEAYAAGDQALGRMLATIRGAAERGAKVTKYLLAFSRNQPLQPELIEPVARLRDLVAALRVLLRGNITIETDFPPGLWTLRIDPSELELALLNLALNARDAMPEGGALHLSAANRTVRDGQLGMAGDYLVITVADNGAGIPPEILPRVFDPFFTTKDVGAGSGLGLSQVHGFAHQSGGAVDIESTLGKGTTVRVYLPASHGLAARATAAESTAHPYPAAGTVLVVEDDVEVAHLAVELLQGCGFGVRLAYRAQAALDLLFNGERVDLIFSDIVMPDGMSGIELAEAVKSHFPKIPVLLATGYSDAVIDAIAKGLQIITKPYRTRELCECITGLLHPPQR